MDIIDSKIGTSLIGIHSPNQGYVKSIKRNTKNETITLNLEHTFIKQMNLPFENYYRRVECIMTKIDRRKIPELSIKV